MKKNILKKHAVAKLLVLPTLFIGSLLFFSPSLQAQSSSGSSTSKSGGSGASSSQLDLQQFNQNLTGSDATDTTEECGGVKIAFNVGCRDDFSNPIIAYLVAILRFLTYGVGIVVILMIVVGGIQYAAAGDNAQSVSAAKSRIFNAVVALLLYIFAFAILNFIVPGGLIG